MVTKFPDMRISAPRSVETNEDTERDGRPEVLRMESIDTDTIIALFDRDPTRDQFPDGITLHGPEHQLCSMLGEAGDLTQTKLTFRYKPVTTIDQVHDTQSTLSPSAESRVFNSTDDPDTLPFDFNTRAVKPQALLDAAAFSGYKMDRTGWTARADSWEAKAPPAPEPPSNVLDGDIHTIWHTQWVDSIAPLPHWIEIDMQASATVVGLIYTPRQPLDSFNGTIGQYEIYVSDNQIYTNPVAQGTFVQTRDSTTVNFPPSRGRYVMLKALSEVQSPTNQWTSCAELNLLGAAIFDQALDTASLMGAQLISEVPKLKLTCSASLQSAPTSTDGFFSTSVPRPGKTSILNVPPPSIHSPRTVQSAPFAAVSAPPSAETTPRLAALARVDLYLDLATDNSIWDQNFFPFTHNPIWQYQPAQPLTPSQYQPQAIVNIFNLRATDRSLSQPTQRGLFSVLPLNLGFSTNVQVSIRLTPTAPNSGSLTKLRSLQINFPVGTEVYTFSPSPSPILRPFNNNIPPNVRPVAVGKRWLASAALNTVDSETSLAVTLTPNTGDSTNANYLAGGYYWDITANSDLSFVLENVLLNGPSDESYSQALPARVTTTEEYVLDPANTLTSVTGEVGLEIALMNARQAP